MNVVLNRTVVVDSDFLTVTILFIVRLQIKKKKQVFMYVSRVRYLGF